MKPAMMEKLARKCFSLVRVKCANNLGFWGLMRMLKGGVRKEGDVWRHGSWSLVLLRASWD